MADTRLNVTVLKSLPPRTTVIASETATSPIVRSATAASDGSLIALIPGSPSNSPGASLGGTAPAPAQPPQWAIDLGRDLALLFGGPQDPLDNQNAASSSVQRSTR